MTQISIRVEIRRAVCAAYSGETNASRDSTYRVNRRDHSRRACYRTNQFSCEVPHASGHRRLQRETRPPDRLNIERKVYLYLYFIELYCNVLCCIVFYCIVLYYIVSYCIVMYSIVSYCIILYRIVLYCIYLPVPARVPTPINRRL